jgi:hypothetical protein
MKEPSRVKNTSFMPRIKFYRSLLFLTGMYLNLLGPFNKMEIVFLFFPNSLLHSFLGKKRILIWTAA